MSATSRGSRLAPAMVGVVQFAIAGAILYFAGSGILAAIGIGLFVLMGLASFKTALFGSQELLDQMTSGEELNAETEKEFAKLHGLRDDDSK